MAIPVSTIVNVSITATPLAPSRAGFGTLLFITTETGVPISEGVRTYASVAEVAEDWGPTTEVTVAATAYFSQSPKPTTFAVGLRDAAETNLATTLDRLANASAEWYAFALSKDQRDGTAITEGAAWAEARVKQFFVTTNDVLTINPADETCVAYVLNGLGYRRTFVMYSSTAAQYPEVSAFARAATVNFDATDTVITLKFKTLPGISVETITSAQLNAVTAKGCNVYVRIGGVNILTEGIMSAGIGVFQDTIHGIDWLQNAIETNVYAYLVTRATKVPYTDKGVSALEFEVRRALDAAVRNGLVAPGYSFDGDYLPLGYTTTVGQIQDVDTASRQQRISPPIQFTAIGAGAIHGVTINGLFEA